MYIFGEEVEEGQKDVPEEEASPQFAISGVTIVERNKIFGLGEENDNEWRVQTFDGEKWSLL